MSFIEKYYFGGEHEGSLINWISENKVFGGGFYGDRIMLFSYGGEDRFDG